MIGDKKPKPGTPETQAVPSQSPEVNLPETDYDKIYVSEELLSTNIEGVLFKWRELPGEDIIKMTKDLQKDPNKGDDVFIKTLIDACVVVPANLDVSKLKPLVYTLLSAEIQASFGLTEVVQKNLEKRFGLSPASMQ